MPANEPLKAVSSIIELKPGKTYMLIITTDEVEEGRVFLEQISTIMQAYGIQGFGVTLRTSEGFEIVEIPEGMHDAS